MQPKLEEPFEIEVDASGYAIRAILIQRDEKGKRHPIAYFSTTLTDAEHNYNIYELEFYAIVRALCHWRQFVAGSPTRSRFIWTIRTYNIGNNPTRFPKGLRDRHRR